MMGFLRKFGILFIVFSFLLLLIYPDGIDDTGYSYKYTKYDTGFMSFHSKGYGVICPGQFGAYYESRDWGEDVFVRSFELTPDILRRLNDPYTFVNDMRKHATTVNLTRNGNRSTLILEWEDRGEFVNTYYRVVAVYVNDELREVSYETSHSLNYDPRNSSVCVDYIDVHIKYRVQKTRCWIKGIIWWKSALKNYLRSMAGEVEKHGNEPW
ncbi:Hypothetical protein TGAM_1796 [Thermococcus gammatolerans EJ3]|uniref:Uncharacterized protein n=2 Tax=Thermococcus TaxID=2263 RepID=C5A1M9_THEGJ|nr:Hypothetical protein TGAM_1796 [Thermococcus gammatolerans EJ3]